MAESSTEDQRNRRPRRQNGPATVKLLVSFGLGATITSGFAAGSDVFKGWQSADEQRCSIAQHVVLDESPSPALNPGQRAHLNDLAMQRLEACVGGSA